MICFVKVVAGASCNKIESFCEGVLKVKIQAPREKGRANDALIAFLAASFRIPQRQIQILSGHTSPFKKLTLEGVSEEIFLQRIQEFL